MLRNATQFDAGFILALRTNMTRAKHLSPTSPELELQIAWLKNYATDKDQAYFIIESHDTPLGTVRLYDAQGGSFCWGSWIIGAAAPQTAAIESALMVYAYATDCLGFQAAHFDVRTGNQSVWQFHERFGAVRVREADDAYFYEITLPAIQQSRERYNRFLPHGIVVDNESVDL